MEDLADKALRRLQLFCRHPVEHLLGGEYRSVFKGRGVEFDELREYVPGDDVRTIDWRSLARTGRPHIRRYIEEREQSLLIAVDVSASALFGSGGRSKLQAAHEAAALLAWSAARNHDRVGLLLFTDRIERFIPAARGRNHVLHVLAELVKFTPGRVGTDIAAALDFIGRVSRKRGIVFLFSDFLGEGYGESMRMLSRRHDLTAVLMRDPAERRLPSGALITLSDPETGGMRLVDSTSAGPLSSHSADRFFALCRDGEIDHFELGPDMDCVEVVSGYLRRRHRRAIRETGG